MVTKVPKQNYVEGGDVMIVDNRESKRRSTWTALVQLAKKTHEEKERNIAIENSNYINTQIRHADGITPPIPNSTAGTIRVNIPSQTTTAKIGTTLKTEIFTGRITSKGSGGGRRGNSRGAR